MPRSVRTFLPISERSTSTCTIFARGANVDGLAGDAIVVPASDPDQQVAMLERLVGVHPAVHARVAGAQPMRLVDVADAEQRVRDRDLGALGDLAAAGRSRRRSARRGRSGSADARTRRSSRPARRPRARHRGSGEAGPGRRSSCGSGCGADGLRLEHVLREVEQHRPGSPGARDLERLREASGTSSGSITTVAYFVTGNAIPTMSVSWKASLPSSARGTLPVIATIGTESIIAVARPVTRLIAPGPDVAMATPTPSWRG